MGHVAQNLFNQGFKVLYEGKLASFLLKSSRRATNLGIARELKRNHSDDQIDNEINCILSAMDIDDDFQPPMPSAPSPTLSRSQSQSPIPSDSSDHSTTSNSSSLDSEIKENEECEDYSNVKACSGSDLTPIIDEESGKLLTDWYEREELDEDPEDVDEDDDEGDVLKSYSDHEGNWSDDD